MIKKSDEICIPAGDPGAVQGVADRPYVAVRGLEPAGHGRSGAAGSPTRPATDRRRLAGPLAGGHRPAEPARDQLLGLPGRGAPAPNPGRSARTDVVRRRPGRRLPADPGHSTSADLCPRLWRRLGKTAGRCPQRIHTNRAAGDTKSDAGGRVVGLPAALGDLLREHRVEQERWREAARQLWQDGDWVFTSRVGAPLNPSSDYHRWKALLREAGVRDGRLHDARHMAATVLLVLGVPERTVMGIMGWSSTAMAALPARHRPDPATGGQPSRRPAVVRRPGRSEWQLRLELRLDPDRSSYREQHASVSALVTGAEDGGFEPPRAVNPTRFPSVRHRPLGESSWCCRESVSVRKRRTESASGGVGLSAWGRPRSDPEEWPTASGGVGRSP